MTDAPERLWIDLEMDGIIYDAPRSTKYGASNTTEYIRADIHAAELATLCAEIARLTGERLDAVAIKNAALSEAADLLLSYAAISNSGQAQGLREGAVLIRPVPL